MSRSKPFILLLAAGLSLVAVTPPASADQDRNPPFVVVNYSDLDLGGSSGIATLNRRIEVAAKRVCADQKIGPALEAARDYRKCLDLAKASARPQVELAKARANGLQMARRAPNTVSVR
jgi:UrcA family protein